MNKILCFIIVLLEIFVSSCNSVTPTPSTQSQIPSKTPTLSPTSTVLLPTLVVLEGCAKEYSIRIRSAPSTQTDILGGISSNSCVSIYGRNKDSSWVWIKTGDIVGWVSVENIFINGEISQLSIFSENGENGISQNVFPEATTTLTVITRSPFKTNTPIPTPKKTSTPRLMPTTATLLCKDTYSMGGSMVKCKIPRAYCSYQLATSGNPTFCNDARYPNHNFVLVVWGEDWSDLDGRCIVVSGQISFFDGKPQIEAISRSQVTYCN